MSALLSHYLKYFLLSLILVFLMVIMQHVKPVSRNQISPASLSLPKSNIFENIKFKLRQKPFSFTVKNSLVPNVSAASEIDLAAAYGVVDLDTGEVIVQKNFSNKLPIASLTKIMTAVVALDLASTDDLLYISRTAARQVPTKLGLISGQQITLEEGLNGLLLVSANDAAKVIEEGINRKYNEEVFIRSMNEKARILGLKNSLFENSQGLDGVNQKSSIEDLVILSKYALTYPVIAQIVRKDYQYYPQNQNHKQIDMYNWNGLLGVYPGVKGLKIGNTDDAGYNSIVYAEREGKKILAVVLGAPGVLERDLWAGKLLDLGFQKFGISSANISEEKLKAKYKTWKYWN